MSDQEMIDGSWICVATLHEGVQVEDYVGVEAIMNAGDLTWLFPKPDGSTHEVEATYSIDPQQNPKHFDWSTNSDPDHVHQRLYLLEGDTLIWSANLGNNPRPENFTAGHWQFIMKRMPED